MKSYRKELWFNTRDRREFINITPQVQQCLEESGFKEGLAPETMVDTIEAVYEKLLSD